MFDLHIDVGSSVLLAILNTCRCHLRSVMFNDRLLSSRARALIVSPHREHELLQRSTSPHREHELLQRSMHSEIPSRTRPRNPKNSCTKSTLAKTWIENRNIRYQKLLLLQNSIGGSQTQKLRLLVGNFWEICVMPKRKRSALPKPRAGRRRRSDDDEDGIPHLPVAVQPLTAEDLIFLCCLVGVGSPHFVVWIWCPCGARAGSRQMTTTHHINKHTTNM